MTATDSTAALTDDEVRDMVVSWLRENLPKEWVEAIDEGDDDKLRKARASLNQQDFLERMGAAGWTTPTWPKEYSGAGLPHEQARFVNEALNQYKAPRSFNIIGLGMGGPTLLQWGSEELKQRYLPPLAQNKEIWCQLFSEPGNGSDVAGLATRAVRDGDEWIVNGQKVWTTLAHIASVGMLVARTNPDVPKHKGLSYFIVDMHAPGVEVRPLKQITGDAEFNEVFFTDVRIPDSHRVADEGQGWAVATTTLMNERVALSGAGSAGSENVGGGPVDAVIQLAKANGAWDDPVIRQRLITALIEQRVLKVTNFRAAAKRKAGFSPGAEGSVTKLFSAEHNQRLQSLALDVLGSGAMAWDSSDGQANNLVRGFLRSRANTIEGGTSEIMRNILGERVLALPKEPDISRDLPWKDVPRNAG